MTLAAAIAAGASENLVEEYVRQCAQLGHWLRYHTHDSRRSPAGFPDEVLVHASLGLTVFAELKGYDVRGRLGVASPKQLEWLAGLRDAGQFAFLWTPHDADLIADVLIRHTLPDTLPPLPTRTRKARQ
jgi:hypothetical protein